MASLAELGPAEEAAGLPVAEKSRGPLPFLDQEGVSEETQTPGSFGWGRGGLLESNGQN